MRVKGIPIDTFQVKSDGKIGEEQCAGPSGKATLMAFLLSMPIVLYGMNVARSIFQEKTSRIFEVMLATASPTTCWPAS